MPRNNTLTQQEKKLVRRYLVWCYKTTKEDLDRIDRYFTQFKIDSFMLEQLVRHKDYRNDDGVYKKLVDEFGSYLKKKKENADSKKFLNGKDNRLSPQYCYLKNRYAAIEKAITRFLGKKDLIKIQQAYEAEMTQRILQAREHT